MIIEAVEDSVAMYVYPCICTHVGILPLVICSLIWEGVLLPSKVYLCFGVDLEFVDGALMCGERS